MKRGDQIIYTLLPIFIAGIILVPLFLLSFYSSKSKRVRDRIRDNPEVLRNNFIPLINFTGSQRPLPSDDPWHPEA